MNKCWLIRTKNNHILGPVSREKIRELIGNGSIKGDDEICCGNGYWIYVREQDLVAKYILNNETQPFNPVQEAEPVLALSPMADDLAYPGEDVMPNNGDLEYPDGVEESQADITKIGMSLKDLHEEEDDIELTDDLEGDPSDLLSDQEKKKSDLTKKEQSSKKVTDDVAIPKLKNRRQKKAPVPKKAVGQSFLQGKTLILILMALLVIAIILLMNRSELIKTFINETSQINLIDSAYGQVVKEPSKKKSGSIL